MARRTEFDVLKESHKFLRDDEEEPSNSWNDQLAKKYYDSLWKEFAVCDLKHYRSGRFALRWRSEAEVLSGSGERTCGNTRCPLHPSIPDEDERVPGLLTLELPFDYVEHGEHKNALVKVVLCPKCVKKIMWKREQEKKAAAAGARVPSSPEHVPSSTNMGNGTEGEGRITRLEGDGGRSHVSASRSETRNRRSASPLLRGSPSSRGNAT